MTLSGKKILIGITGGIAAYKIYELIRKLIKLNAEVKTVITPSAREFVTETTLRTLTRNPVYSEQFDVQEWKPEHISLADDADLFLIAPASANTIGKIANGICDNLLTSLAAAFNKPLIIAPAMNCNMWNNSFVQKNLKSLIDAGYYIIYPEEGELSCGYDGQGRLANNEIILNKIFEIMNKEKFLLNKSILVTAGGTIEPIDPVRYIGNHSSGKMGIAIADAAHDFGAEVCLVSTVKVKKPYKVINTTSALQMMEAVKSEFSQSDALIMAAAVSDYRIDKAAEQKIKKEINDSLTLNLVKNPDILQEISKIKRENQVVIGFCAESQDLISSAKKKIEHKNLDYIVANDISNKDATFGSDYNEITIINKKFEEIKIHKALKTEIAKTILREVFK